MHFYGAFNEGLRHKRARVSLNSLTGDRMQLTYVRLEPGESTDHAHDNEQMGYILSGEAEVTIDGETRTCRPGDAYSVPANVPHGFRVLDRPVEYLEAFAPPKGENKA